MHAASVLFAGALVGCCATLGAQARAHYHLAFAVGDESARITVQVTGAPDAELTLRMPAWAPDYEPGAPPAPAPPALALTARAGNRTLPVTARSRWEWTVRPVAGAVTLEYRLPLLGPRVPVGLGQRLPHQAERNGKPVTVRYHEAFVLRGGATWLQVPGTGARITFALPAGFEVAAATARAADGSYTTDSLAPFHIGQFEQLRFEVDGKPHQVVLSGFGRDRTDRQGLLERLTRIVRANRAAMGPLPYAAYTFLIGRQSSQPGGTGHPTAAEVIAATLRDHGVLHRDLAHAHLAAWDTGFFRPAGHLEATPGQRTLTESAWFWLGTREYLTELSVVRAGLETPEAFWTRLVAGHINRLRQDERRLEHSVATTGARMLRPSEVPRGAPHPRRFGFLLCLLLDVQIRVASGGARSLHDAIQTLQAACRDRRRGYTADEVRAACERAAGQPLGELFARVTAAGELPLTATLARIGIQAGPRPGTPTGPDQPRRRPPRWYVAEAADAAPPVVTLRTALTR